MSVDFVHEVEIERPAQDVFEYVADFENNPRWQGGMKSCRWTSETPKVVGATYVQEARFLGRRIDTHFRVCAFERQPTGVLELMSGLVSRSVKKDYAKLKALLEGK